MQEKMHKSIIQQTKELSKHKNETVLDAKSNKTLSCIMNASENFPGVNVFPHIPTLAVFERVSAASCLTTAS